MWAAHQVHHSSEDYNLTTALRQSVVQNYTSAVSFQGGSLRVGTKEIKGSYHPTHEYEIFVSCPVLDVFLP